ncbi:MAG: hypothetical protein IJS74_01875 [Clostridia bacterium]|nr:hypothetical protein [Clostridia bacterium]
MDRKKEWITAINIGKYVAFIVATVSVIISQFLGDTIWVKFALIAYVSAFALTFTALVFHANEIYKAGREAKKDNAEVVKPDQENQGIVDINNGELKGTSAEVVNLKTEQVWTVIGAVASGIFTIFTFVVLILF